MKLMIVISAVLGIAYLTGELPTILQIPLPLTASILFTLAVIFALKKA